MRLPDFTAANIPSLPDVVLPALLTTIRSNGAFSKEKAAVLKAFQIVYPAENVRADLFPLLYAERVETNRMNNSGAEEAWTKGDALLASSPEQVASICIPTPRNQCTCAVFL